MSEFQPPAAGFAPLAGGRSAGLIPRHQLAIDADTRVTTMANVLSGGGDLGELMRSLDWAATPLGAPGGWGTSAIGRASASVRWAYDHSAV